ncbi:uncharacterized protein LOC129906807 [Episyrphus balteatus]|uniref:uncharacterized protein LOC129906807 n=1 Tax=Episyrphus balteatus TaxID=286459 RepID=UPI0024854E39|nr:uncharacterized protein LOC129906807 [Episyrphus balteatus]XP_055838706.1 uncharacterized protein LOC129906807 [Episyrphus balteatus]
MQSTEPESSNVVINSNAEKYDHLPSVSNSVVHDADNFLSRCNWNNEKINNILRSPPGVRQRSVFTANPPVTKFNVSAPPFVSAAAATSTQHRTQNAPKEHFNSGQFYHHRQSATTYNDSPAARMMRSLSARYSPSAVYGSSAGIKSATTASNDMRPIVIMQAGSLSPSMPTFSGRISNRDYENSYATGPIALPNGTIQIRLRDGVCIDMTLDKAVRVFNTRSMVALALSSNGSVSAMVHPNGRVHQNGSRVEIVTYDGMKSNNYVRYAKMWYKGVSFTSENCALTYLVDTAGTRTTTDSFIDMSKDYTIFVFYNDSRHGPACVQEAAAVVQNSIISCSEDGTETYEINGFRISQAADGLVKLTRTHNKCLIRTSPTNGSATLTTPAIHCTASLGKTSHLFVRRGEKRMHFDGSCFIVRNAGHSAGFNEENLLIVY